MMTFKDLLRLLTALLVSTSLVGCLLGPGEDPEAGEDDPSAEYESREEGLRLEQTGRMAPAPMQIIPAKEGRGHGTPDPLEPMYDMPTRNTHTKGNWGE